MKLDVAYYPADNGRVEVPDGAQVVYVEYHDEGGLGCRKTVSGVWAASTVALPSPR